MANEQDLVKEIEEAEDFIGGYIRIRTHPTEVTVSMDCLVNIRATLQRAREALSEKALTEQEKQEALSKFYHDLWGNMRDLTPEEKDALNRACNEMLKEAPSSFVKTTEDK